MIYGFNEKKEKVRLICIEKTITTSSQGIKQIVSPSELHDDYGVDDITKLAFVGFSYDSNVGDADVFVTPHHVKEPPQTSTDYAGYVYPYVEFKRDDTSGGVTFWGQHANWTVKVQVLLVEMA